MENNKKIQYAVAFSVIVILVFQSFSNIILQNVYALSLSYITDSHLTGRDILSTARTPSYLWVLHMGTTSGSLRISVFNATMGYAHFITQNVGSDGGCGTAVFGLSVLPSSHDGLEDVIFNCYNGDIVRYSVISGSPSHIDLTGDFSEPPCTKFNDSIEFTDTGRISFSCPNQNIVGFMNPVSMSPQRVIAIPDNECSGHISAIYTDESQEIMIVNCYVSSGHQAHILLYDMPSPLGLNLVDSLTLEGQGFRDDELACSHDLGRCVLSSFYQPGALVFQYNVDSSVPSGVLTSFGYLTNAGGHFGAFVTDDSSIGSIGIVSSDNSNQLIGLNRNATVNPLYLGGLLCTVSLCIPMGVSGSTSFYHLGDDETFYFATHTGGKVGIMNITGAEQYTINDNDLNGGSTAGGSSGNTTGGVTGGTNSTGDTCDFSDPECTIPKQVGHGLCVFHLFDCDTNDDIKTNGVGFLLLIVMLGLLIVFFAILRKKANLQIHPIIWVGGMLAVFGLAVGAQLIEGYWFILAIVVIVAFGGFNFWNGRRGES